MKVYHMIVARDAAERMGDYSTRREYKSKRQGSAPNGYICVGVCGYHEEQRKPKNNICLCEYCIAEIRSRGERVSVGERSPEIGVCEWCGDEDELFTCHF